MAQYEITRACGHTETINITGSNTHGESDHRANQATHHPCDECRHTERDATNSEAARIATETALPPLTGSDKQIAWAHTIRLAGLADIADSAARQLAGRYPGAVDTLTEICTRLALAHTDANWWINNRTNIYTAAKQEMTPADRTRMQEAAK